MRKTDLEAPEMLLANDLPLGSLTKKCAETPSNGLDLVTRNAEDPHIRAPGRMVQWWGKINSGFLQCHVVIELSGKS